MIAPTRAESENDAAMDAAQSTAGLPERIAASASAADSQPTLQIREVTEIVPGANYGIFIGDAIVGSVTPTAISDDARWHAAIQLDVPETPSASYLAQGFGPTPATAVITAIEIGWKELKAFAERLSAIERATRWPKAQEDDGGSTLDPDTGRRMVGGACVETDA